MPPYVTFACQGISPCRQKKAGTYVSYWSSGFCVVPVIAFNKLCQDGASHGQGINLPAALDCPKAKLGAEDWPTAGVELAPPAIPLPPNAPPNPPGAAPDCPKAGTDAAAVGAMPDCPKAGVGAAACAMPDCPKAGVGAACAMPDCPKAGAEAPAVCPNKVGDAAGAEPGIPKEGVDAVAAADPKDAAEPDWPKAGADDGVGWAPNRGADAGNVCPEEGAAAVPGCEAPKAKFDVLAAVLDAVAAVPCCEGD